MKKDTRARYTCSHENCKKSFLHQISLDNHVKRLHAKPEPEQLVSLARKSSTQSSFGLFARFSFLVKDEMKRIEDVSVHDHKLC